MRKGACFICEEPGHMARDHKEYEAKKGRTWGNTSPPQKKTIKEIHALLQELSPHEIKELLVLQFTNQKKEEKEEKRMMRIFKAEDCFDVSASCHPIYCPISSSLD